MPKRIFALLIAGILIAVTVATAVAIDFTGMESDTETIIDMSSVQDTTTGDYLSVELCDVVDDGVIRVFLKSLNLPLSMTISLEGAYTLGDDENRRFESGSKIILSDGGDRIFMTVGGFTMDVGKEVRLIRRGTDPEQSGLRIAETQRTNIYPGDLTVTIEEKGGGLRPVLSVNIEDYLKGVIAYEMGDAWPVETLKSQAIAARTYAMQRKEAADGKDYDLVDTTADQVYRGTDVTLLNVRAAVEATRGVVGRYKGKFATCFYTASNGGEIALPSDVWEGQSTDYGYLERREDPYDLENPNSIEKTLSFSGDCSEIPELVDMIEEALLQVAGENGEENEGLRFESILSMETVDPVAEGSIMYRKLRLSVSVTREREEYVPGIYDAGAPVEATGDIAADIALSGIDILDRVQKGTGYEKEPVFEEVEEPYTVDLDLYEQIKPLGLAINTSDCELFQVDGGQFGYTITARRFGHGVGMSQRGAQRMGGTHNMTWQEILAFYYPGMGISRVEWQTPEIAPLPALPSNVGVAYNGPATTPVPAALPALQEGEYYAKVILDSSSSTLNLRAAPTTDSRIVAMLAAGQRVIVSSTEDENGWVSAHTAEYSGFVKAEYLEKEN